MNQANLETVTIALQQALKSKKLPANKLGLLLAQVAHETNGFQSKLTHVNNYSGIKWVNQKGASNSLIMSPEKNYYASYLTPTAWANDFIRILSKGTKGTRPIDANGFTSFANSLKRHGYFTDSVDNYLHGLESWGEAIKNKFHKIPFPSGIISQGELFTAIIIFLFLTLKNNLQ